MKPTSKKRRKEPVTEYPADSYAEQLRRESRKDDRKKRLKTTGSLPKSGEKLTAAATGEEEQKKELSYDHLGTDPFDEASLTAAWKKFEEGHAKSGARDSERMVLKQPRTIRDNHVELTLSNALQHDILMRFHADLVGFLRNELNNKQIEVRPVINEEETGEMVYTNREKFEYMVKINPALKDLSDRLGLDPDV